MMKYKTVQIFKQIKNIKYINYIGNLYKIYVVYRTNKTKQGALKMQAIKTYIKKVKLVNPLTLFKKWFLADITQTFAELNNSLDNRLDNLESKTDVEDVERRVEDLEYYDLHDIQERAENAERIAEDHENKLDGLIDNIVNIEGDIKIIKTVDFSGIAERFEQLENKLKNKQPAKKASQLVKERQLEKERSEKSLSDMQRLAFEICHYYGGEFDLDDFDNCYEVINKYDVVRRVK